MSKPCSICSHADRERIDQELAISKSVAAVAKRWGFNRRTLSYHRQRHMKQEDIARLRFNLPTELEIDIDEMTRRGGQEAILGLKRLNLELQERAAIYDAAGNYNAANRARDIQFKVYIEQARLAAMYPGLKSTVNNNLVVADGEMVFRLVDKALEKFPEARRALASAYREWSQAEQPALESHE